MKQHVILSDDLVVGFASGDLNEVDSPFVPQGMEGLPAERLRFVQGRVVDAALSSIFFVDSAGIKHLVDADGRQHLACAWDARLMRDGAVWRVSQETDRIAGIKEALKIEIDSDAEKHRLRYITAGAGQAMVYQRKGEEARRLIAWRETNQEGMPSPSDYPILAATIGIEGDTLDDVAALVTSTETAWLSVAALIETARLATKAAIEAAQTETAARNARANVIWP